LGIIRGVFGFKNHLKNYEASIGRFHNVDPLIEVTQNWIPYRLAINNPVYYSDSSGLNEFIYDNNDNLTGFSISNTNEISALLEYSSHNPDGLYLVSFAMVKCLEIFTRKEHSNSYFF